MVERKRHMKEAKAYIDRKVLANLNFHTTICEET